MDGRVRKVIALMKEHLHKGWPASRLAGFVNLSPSRLHQLFKDETGLPPAKYLRLLRMQQAQELLETSYLSVKEVMARVGVTDESHFVRDFKKTYGCTPAKYRARFLNGQLDQVMLAEHPRLISLPAQSLSNLSLRRPSPKSTAMASTVSPLLLRRPSHPHHLTQERTQPPHNHKKRELLSLLSLRHMAFAEMTTAITANIVRGMLGVRSIVYRPRPSTVSRRQPPTVERPQSASRRRR